MHYSYETKRLLKSELGKVLSEYGQRGYRLVSCLPINEMEVEAIFERQIPASKDVPFKPETRKPHSFWWRWPGHEKQL